MLGVFSVFVADISELGNDVVRVFLVAMVMMTMGITQGMITASGIQMGDDSVGDVIRDDG